MTNEEIEAALKLIASVVDPHGPVTFYGRAQALDRLDALCAAARRPESLVGKRVRLKNANPGVVGRVIKQNKPYCILWNGGTWSHDYDRSDIEPLEVDDAG